MSYKQELRLEKYVKWFITIVTISVLISTFSFSWNMCRYNHRVSIAELNGAKKARYLLTIDLGFTKKFRCEAISFRKDTVTNLFYVVFNTYNSKEKRKTQKYCQDTAIYKSSEIIKIDTLGVMDYE